MADDTERLLASGEVQPLGRITESSNGAVLVRVTLDDASRLAIHKPVALERPLWDYPDGTLAGRERAAYLISEAGGFGIVPTTVLHEGPWGPAATQEWVGEPHLAPGMVVDVLPPPDVPPGWREVLRGETPDGEEVVVAHATDAAVRSAAVFDALINNSDRKGGHLLRVHDTLWGVDHGVSLGVEPKLRTVLWGWAGEVLPDSDVDKVRAVLNGLVEGDLRAALAPLLTGPELAALADRARSLLDERRHPLPRPGWPAIPWPAL
ncbi:SCO1664 family protein [Knoellia subterranea]|uniref:Phosphatidylinositol 3-and 4-kinase catalytic subunit n=1 Tax=Knoellia subterranea KCTC 19937 TaxID=1385521 RepID=A0A0A0JNI1_9MICO|nr:SCO1664 family protein [Knoellia subterranea]KGN38703.1 phosphatidylinositol 3- and 4-kinase catalytic subunit [Knoellia subterranea KCTC 19937]